MFSVQEVLAPLNPEQRTAVTAPLGPVQIFAGPGSGKTRVLTHRIAYLVLTRQVRPEHVCAVTFTNKAAKEMKERLEGMLGKEMVHLMQVSTSHSLGLKIIREHPTAAGRRRNLTIYAEDEQRALIKSLLDEMQAAAGMSNGKDVEGPQDGLLSEPAEASATGGRPVGVAVAMSDEKKTIRVPELGEVQDFISDAKNKLLTPLQVRHLDKGLSDIYQAYEDALARANAVDFDDLLKIPVEMFRRDPALLQRYQNEHRAIFVDEYQDTNHAQYAMISLLGSASQQVTVVGDEDQCLVAGTLVTMADGSQRPIEEVKSGDLVLSSYAGELKASLVSRTVVRNAESIVRIELESGTAISSTPDHTHFAGHVLGMTPQLYFTYLMYRRDYGFRVGTSRTYTNSQVKPVVGYLQRCSHEEGDALWVISVHDSEADALMDEYVTSLKYRLPALPFKHRYSGANRGLIGNQAYIDQVFATFDTKAGALQLLSDRGLLINHPHFTPRSRNSSRCNVTLTLCGDETGHRIGIQGNNDETAQTLRQAGFSVRASKRQGWRMETSRASWEEALRLASEITTLLNVNLTLRANLGPVGKELRSLPFIPAGSVVRGMVMFGADGRYDIVRDVQRLDAPQTVYDIDVACTHNFIANGIITHNSIYGWRGADSSNFLSFRSDYPQAQTVTLERNYRSTQHVLSIARQLIQHNRHRRDKNLWSPRTAERHAMLCTTSTDRDEAEYVVSEIDRLHRDEGLPHSAFAVLYRTNSQSRAFETALNRKRIPYQIANGTAFYDRMEIRDVMAYLKFLTNPSDLVSFRRIINKPARGIGEKTVDSIVAESRRLRASPLETMRRLQPGEVRVKKAYMAIKDFVTMFDQLTTEAADMPLEELMQALVTRSNYMTSFNSMRQEEREMRTDNVYELLGYASQNGTVGIEGAIEFLQETSLAGDDDNLDATKPQVTLATLHKSKGLEFPVVFVTGVEEGLLPHERRFSQEEERCLFYVGITRAKDKLYLTHANMRQRFGKMAYSSPSSFLDEIPAELLQVIDLDPYSLAV
jgi:DNA helicase-2/ATP-dependent DNA helicase PcrA